MPNDQRDASGGHRLTRAGFVWQDAPVGLDEDAKGPAADRRESTLGSAVFSPVTEPPSTRVQSMDWIAVYAAVVGTGTLAWGIYRDRHGDRFDIAVDVKQDIVLLEPGSKRPRFTLVVTATNHGGSDEMVEYIGVDYFDPTSPQTDGGLMGDSRHITAELRPRQNVSQGFDLGGRMFRVGREYRGFVRFATGTLRTSVWQELDIGTLNTVGIADMIVSPRAVKLAGLELPEDARRPERNEGSSINFLH